MRKSSVNAKARPLLAKSYDQPWSVDQLLASAQSDADQYVQLAASKPSWLTSRDGWLDDLIEEMRSTIMDEVMGVVDEGSTEDLSALEVSRLQMRLREIVDEAERKMRADAMSLLDRIGAPDKHAAPASTKTGAYNLYR